MLAKASELKAFIQEHMWSGDCEILARAAVRAVDRWSTRDCDYIKVALTGQENFSYTWDDPKDAADARAEFIRGLNACDLVRILQASKGKANIQDALLGPVVHDAVI